MLTRIDRVMVAVPSLGQGIDAYARVGFGIHPGGAHPGTGTYNAIAFHGGDDLELMSVSDRAEYLAARTAASNAGPSLLNTLASGGRCGYVIV